MKPTIVPFIKWVGGKRQIIKKIDNRLPLDFNSYHEPFIGGGALFFHLQPKVAYISDLNAELINAYKVIKNQIDSLKEYLLLMEYAHTEEFFKKIRGIDRNEVVGDRELTMSSSDVLRAARFIYLNKAGFNGLYRVNKKGHFNVPSGKKIKLKTFDTKSIEKASKFLQNGDVTIYQGSYEESLKNIKKRDFVYLDPPYDYEEGQKGFDSYQKDSFGQNGQKLLAEYCKKIDKKGAFFMLSNHNTKLIRSLYSDFHVDVISAKRLVGGKNASRQDVEEVLVRNYE